MSSVAGVLICPPSCPGGELHGQRWLQVKSVAGCKSGFTQLLDVVTCLCLRSWSCPDCPGHCLLQLNRWKTPESCFVSVWLVKLLTVVLYKCFRDCRQTCGCSAPVTLDLSAFGQRVSSAEFLNLSVCWLLFGLHRYQRCFLSLSLAALSDQDHFHGSAWPCGPQNTVNPTGNKHSCTVCPAKWFVHLSEFTVKTFTFLWGSVAADCDL